MNVRYFLVALLIAPSMLAQTTGSLSGNVVTYDGTPLPHAVVAVRSSTLKRTTMASAAGAYRFAGLPPGNYSMTFSYPQLNGCGAIVPVSLGRETEANGRLTSAIVCCI